MSVVLDVHTESHVSTKIPFLGGKSFYPTFNVSMFLSQCFNLKKLAKKSLKKVFNLHEDSVLRFIIRKKIDLYVNQCEGNNLKLSSIL